MPFMVGIIFFLYRFFDEHKVRHMLVSLHRWKEWEKKCKL